MIMNKQTKMIFAIKKKVLVKLFDLVKPKMNVGPTESRYMMINVVLMIFSSFLENIVTYFLILLAIKIVSKHILR